VRAVSVCLLALGRLIGGVGGIQTGFVAFEAQLAGTQS
jgi:hypothetical protein